MIGTIGRSRYLARETLVSATISAAISAALFVTFFGAADPAPVWGIGNYAFDFLPQSFAVGFMATLVPGLLCRKAAARGRLPWSGVPAHTSIVRKAFLHGLIALVVGEGLWASALWATGAETIGSAAAFTLKALYGGVLGAAATGATLRQLLR